jgi:hypothetical protein
MFEIFERRQTAITWRGSSIRIQAGVVMDDTPFSDGRLRPWLLSGRRTALKLDSMLSRQFD